MVLRLTPMGSCLPDHMQRSYFQIRSLEVLGVGTSISLFLFVFLFVFGLIHLFNQAEYQVFRPFFPKAQIYNRSLSLWHQHYALLIF